MLDDCDCEMWRLVPGFCEAVGGRLWGIRAVGGVDAGRDESPRRPFGRAESAGDELNEVRRMSFGGEGAGERGMGGESFGLSAGEDAGGGGFARKAESAGTSAMSGANWFCCSSSDFPEGERERSWT